MRTFHIPIILDLNRRGSREGHKPLRLTNEPKISGLCHFFVHSSLIHDIIYNKAIPNAVISAGYSNAVI